MNTQNPFLAFLQELFQRFSAKSPKFFQIFQWISGVLTALTGLPTFLTQLGITLPPVLATFENKIIAAISIGALFMSLLTVKSTAVATSSDGAVLKETDKAKLPFTAANEVKNAEKQGVTKSTSTIEEIKNNI